jgi:hypothetical protein
MRAVSRPEASVTKRLQGLMGNSHPHPAPSAEIGRGYAFGVEQCKIAVQLIHS